MRTTFKCVVEYETTRKTPCQFELYKDGEAYTPQEIVDGLESGRFRLQKRESPTNPLASLMADPDDLRADILGVVGGEWRVIGRVGNTMDPDDREEDYANGESWDVVSEVYGVASEDRAAFDPTAPVSAEVQALLSRFLPT